MLIFFLCGILKLCLYVNFGKKVYQYILGLPIYSFILHWKVYIYVVQCFKCIAPKPLINTIIRSFTMLTNEFLFCRKQISYIHNNFFSMCLFFRIHMWLISFTLYLCVTKYLILYNDHQIKLPWIKRNLIYKKALPGFLCRNEESVYICT